MLARIIGLFGVIALLAAPLYGQSNPILGQWKTIDDETGQVKSIVELYLQDGRLFGKVAEIFPAKGRDPDPVCKKCTGADKDQKITGMVIIKNLEQQDDSWAGGTILDPAKGKVYKAKLWLDGNKLKVRGYLGVFFRTQTWLRVD